MSPSTLACCAALLTDISASFPDVAAALSETTAGRSVTLDGELVALDSGGRPGFGLLQRRMHVARPSAVLLRSVPVTYLVFDVLDIDGVSVRTLPYTQRRALLEGLGVADGRRVTGAAGHDWNRR